MTAYMNHSNDYKKDLASGAGAVSNPAGPGGKQPVDYKRKAHMNLAPRFIFECAIKLNMKPLTSATAAIVFHRFFREVESDAYDEYVSKFSNCKTKMRSLTIFFSVCF